MRTLRTIAVPARRAGAAATTRLCTPRTLLASTRRLVYLRTPRALATARSVGTLPDSTGRMGIARILHGGAAATARLRTPSTLFTSTRRLACLRTARGLPDSTSRMDIARILPSRAGRLGTSRNVHSRMSTLPHRLRTPRTLRSRMSAQSDLRVTHNTTSGRTHHTPRHLLRLKQLPFDR